MEMFTGVKIDRIQSWSVFNMIIVVWPYYISKYAMGIDGEFLLQMLMPPEDGRAGQAIDDRQLSEFM